MLANTLELNGGTIKSGQQNASLAHTGLSHDDNHQVDWQALGEDIVQQPEQPQPVEPRDSGDQQPEPEAPEGPSQDGTPTLTISTDSPLTEATLHEGVVSLTLSGGTYARRWDIEDALTVAGIPGVEIASFGIDRLSDTQITVELEFNGNMATDATLTFTVGADAIVGYNGPPLAAQITVAAITENALAANFPNPFNPETWISYQLAEPAEVAITIYAMNGQVVRRLTLEHQRAGAYAAHWDGRNEFGQSVASGVYFYTLIAGDFIATRKTLIQK